MGKASLFPGGLQVTGPLSTRTSSHGLSAGSGSSRDPTGSQGGGREARQRDQAF